MQAQIRVGVRGQLEVRVVALLEDAQVVQVRTVAAPFHAHPHANAGRRHQRQIVVAGDVDRQRHGVGEEVEVDAAAGELGQGHAGREVDAAQLRVRLAVAPHRQTILLRSVGEGVDVVADGRREDGGVQTGAFSRPGERDAAVPCRFHVQVRVADLETPHRDVRAVGVELFGYRRAA